MILVSVIVPVYNEEKYIHSCVNSILNQDFIEEHKDKIEIIFIDGNSQDKTKSILNNYKRKYSFIQILDNMHKHVQRGLNIGIHQATGEYIVRLDAHAEYAPDYISMCIQTIKATHAQNVGGPMVASHKFYFQKIIAAAYNSKFAFGGAVNYNKNYEGYVDTVFLGCFKRKYLLKLGIYDENMNCNEDDELNFRILLNKNKIYMTPKIKSIYYPRSNLKSLFVQFFRYGFWKIFIIRKHKKIERFTQTIPGIFFIFCATLPIILFSNFTMKLLYISVIFLYFMLNLYFCFSNKYLTKIKDKFLLFFVHFTIHIAYGSGFFSGIFMLKKKRNLKKINLTTSQIRQLQLKSLEIFIFFSNFCDKNNLKFFVCGGCCIGAIRNHGFIPWDDDMDIFMLREDYEKFKKIFTKNNKNKKYFCLLPLNNYEKNINHSFVKIIDTTTTIVKQNNSGCEETTGVELDIFPLDGCPSSHIKRKIQILYALFYCLYSSEVIPEKYGKLVKILCIIFLKLVPGRKNKQKLCLFFEKNMSKYKIKECNYITELCAGPKYMMNKYPKKIFESNILKKFENILVPLPVGYDQYLKIVFGNYMELPQKKDQTPHHNIIFINFN